VYSGSSEQPVSNVAASKHKTSVRISWLPARLRRNIRTPASPTGNRHQRKMPPRRHKHSLFGMCLISIWVKLRNTQTKHSSSGFPDNGHLPDSWDGSALAYPDDRDIGKLPPMGVPLNRWRSCILAFWWPPPSKWQHSSGRLKQQFEMGACPRNQTTSP